MNAAGSGKLALALASVALALLTCRVQAATDRPDSQIARGKYLVKIIGCSDCHTPGGFTPRPDLSRYMGGSDVDFVMPGVGVFVPSNLTPDKATGLGTWSADQIVTAITTGVTPTGRILSPAMPWPDFANLTKSDVLAIAVYLKSLPAVNHRIPVPATERSCGDKAISCIVPREVRANRPK